MASAEKATWKRFWSKVIKTNYCWVWSASKTRGYGSFYFNGKNRRAHRVLWEKVNGPIPDKLVLDHICRNPSCVNPEHLRAVTQRENILCGIGPSAKNVKKTHCSNGHKFDEKNTTYLPARPTDRNCVVCAVARTKNNRKKLKRLRMKTGWRPYSLHVYAAGEKKTNALLTADKVRYIRKVGGKRNPPFQEIADSFGVSKSTVQSAFYRRTWRSVK